MVSTLYLGIDVSMAENVCCTLLPDGTEARRRFTVSNNLPGAESMVKEILLLLNSNHLDRLLIGLESTQSLLVASGLLLALLPAAYSL